MAAKSQRFYTNKVNENPLNSFSVTFIKPASAAELFGSKKNNCNKLRWKLHFEDKRVNI